MCLICAIQSGNPTQIAVQTAILAAPLVPVAYYKTKKSLAKRRKAKNGNKIIIKKGRELDHEIIQFMIKARIKEYGENNKDFEHNEQNSIFFFLKENAVIKAFGMLKPVVLYYQDKEYPIMGIANVMSLEKGKGYGSRIMKAIVEYLDKKNFPALGNTHSDNFEFYKKCGFTFFQSLIERMVYLEPSGKKIKTERENYDMFIYDPKGKLDTIINGNKEIMIKVPFW